MGTSRISKGLFQSNTDHPHAYGDKKRFAIFTKSEKGSSPRVWGQDFFDLWSDYTTGIIPTRMGTRTTDEARELGERDHPHAYGDKISRRQEG